MKTAFIVIWAVFAVLFLLLGLYHWNVSKKDVPFFKLSERRGKDWGRVKILGSDIDQPIKDFAEDFNSYLNEQNMLQKEQNKRSAFGYWLASLTALISMFLVIKN